MKKVRLSQILLILSLLINLSLLSFYFLKLNPEIKQLREKLNVAEKKTNTTNCRRVYNGTTDKFEEICTICPNVWSVSQGKYVYKCATKEELRLQTLSDCSKNFREKLDKEFLSSLKSISDLEKIRELSVKMCMQEAGFEY